LSWQIHRCISPRWAHPQRSAFTAQSGKDARDKWLDEIFPLIRKSPVRKLVARRGSRLRINEGMGNESILWRTGSLIRLLSTSNSSGHSKTLHQATLDEIWHDTDDRREQGLRPAMITVVDAQLLVCSTAGTEASVVLNRKVKAGRKAVKADTGRGIAYFEYSAPDDWDPDDEESYFEFMPALCPDPPCRCGVDDGGWRHTITLDTIRAERASGMPDSEFIRAYGNRPPDKTAGVWELFDGSMWAVQTAPSDAAMADPIALGVWVSPDRDRAAIAAAGHRDAGVGQLVELTGTDAQGLDAREGVHWVPPRLAEIVERHNPIVVVTNDRVLADTGVARLASGPDQTSASALLLAGINATTDEGEPALEVNVKHMGQKELTESASRAVKLQRGKSWVLDVPVGDVCPVGAGALALWGLLTPRVHQKRKTPPAAPQVAKSGSWETADLTNIGF
jgi:hypothetical protein